MAKNRAYLVFLFFFLSFCANAQQVNRYCNSAVPFCLDVPSNFNRLSPSSLGDGQLFTTKDGSQLQVFATFNTDHETLIQRLNREQAALAADSTIANFTQMPISGLAETEEDNYTLTYQSGKLTHQIFRKLENDQWVNLELKYPSTKAKEYQPKMQRMVESLK